MDRRAFLQTLPALAQTRRRPDSPPNILFIMPDQWRGMDLGVAGNTQVRTPNLDRLAREGMLFRGAVANTPVCTPARGTLLTGKYPHSCGVAVNDVPLPAEENTIGKILRERGYFTGFIGKWHLEGGKREPGFVAPGARRMGFEYWAANICSHNYFHQRYFRDDATPIEIKGYDAFGWTDLGIEFLEKAREKGKPFCLYWQPPTPHDPYIPPPGFETMYDPERIELRKNWRAGAKRSGTRKDIAGYYAAIACLDEQIGRLLKKLDDIGQRENTIVFVTSDHGDMHGSQGTFLKRKPWEESVRVPGIFRWPEGIKAGGQSDAPFSHVDVVPTLLELSGSRPPAGMQGASYADYLLGRSKKSPAMAHLMIYTKTEANEYEPWRGVRSRKYKYARFRDRPWMLHDLEKDPYEMENLAGRPESAKLMAKLDAEIERRMRLTGDKWDELHDQPYR
ncbi:MAG TPA: sulfatase [Bryobacteraceae bacterium]|nr:sulfatase [Bryobacteraceae bacterium]